MRIHFCGVRGSTPAPGREFVRYGGHTPCLALTAAGAQTPALVLDAGAGLQRVTGLLGGSPFRGTILLTHVHWDHVLGLPFFAAGDRADAAVQVLVPEQPDGREAAAVLGGLMSPPYFPVGPADLVGSWSFASIAPGTRELEGFEVLVREIPHKGGTTLGYRVSDAGATIAYLPDHCPTALGPGEDGIGEYHRAALELAHEADLLVHDSLMFAEELKQGSSFGHAVADYAVALGRRAGARTVALFHHRHDRTDAQLDGLAARFAGSTPAVSVAAEDMVLEL